MKSVSESFGLIVPKKEKVESEFKRLDADKNGPLILKSLKNMLKK